MVIFVYDNSKSCVDTGHEKVYDENGYLDG